MGVAGFAGALYAAGQQVDKQQRQKLDREMTARKGLAEMYGNLAQHPDLDPRAREYMFDLYGQVVSSEPGKKLPKDVTDVHGAFVRMQEYLAGVDQQEQPRIQAPQQQQPKIPGEHQPRQSFESPGMIPAKRPVSLFRDPNEMLAERQRALLQAQMEADSAAEANRIQSARRYLAEQGLEDQFAVLPSGVNLENLADVGGVGEIRETEDGKYIMIDPRTGEHEVIYEPDPSVAGMETGKPPYWLPIAMAASQGDPEAQKQMGIIVNTQHTLYPQMKELVGESGLMTGRANLRTGRVDAPDSLVGRRLSRIPAGEQETMTDLETLYRDSHQIRAVVKDPEFKKFFGPIAGRATEFFRKIIGPSGVEIFEWAPVPGIPNEVSQAIVKVLNMTDVIARIRTGAQINESEMRLFTKFLPSHTANPEVMLGDLEGMINGLGYVIERRWGKEHLPSVDYKSYIQDTGRSTPSGRGLVYDEKSGTWKTP